MIDKERGLKLLGSGLGPVDVATALGCDPSFISQWLMDDAFRQQVLVMRMESLHLHTARDREIDGIEDLLIGKLKDNVPYMMKTREILQAFAVLNGAKRRGAHSGSGDINFTQNVVAITLPEAAKRAFIPTVNGQGEVVQVGEQITTTMPLATLVQQRLRESAKNAVTVNPQLENKDGNSQESPAASSGTAAKETTTA